MNKYLEKIASSVSKEEIHRSGSRNFWKGVGGGMVGSLVPIPGANIAGSIAGRSHELARLKSSITGKNVKKREVVGDAARQELRATGRGLAQGVGAGISAAGIGAGIAKLLKKDLRSGAMIAGIPAALSASTHGSWKSTHNSTADLAKKYQGKKD